MTYLQCRVETAADRLDELVAKLSAFGFDQIQIECADDFFDYIEHRQTWELVDDELLDAHRGVNAVVLYLTQPEDLLRLRDCLDDLPDCQLTQTQVDEEDWANNWKQYYQPIDIGTRLRIQPAWVPLENADGRVVFYNNPGMSFGTGTHASTLLCLQMLEQVIQGNERVVDIGCGSGILFITARLLGAGPALAVDIDPVACQMAEQNALANGIDQYTICCGDFTANQPLMRQMADSQADLICANLVADLLIWLAPYLTALVRPGARLLASGIIDQQADAVRQAINLPIARQASKDGWTTFLFYRP